MKCLLLLLGCAFVISLATPEMPVMYEISTRPWLYELSQKYGYNISTLRDIPMEELKALAVQGVTYVWFMGMWELGAYGLNHDRTDPSLLSTYSEELPDYTTDDIIGSPYAVVEYTINPNLGTMDDLVWLREQLHEMGMLLMLDFVPNHSACDSPWMDDNINYYVRAPTASSYDSDIYYTNGVAFGNMYGSSPWTDVCQLNYWNNDTRTLMLDNLMIIAEYADAIRCDMAYIILNDYFYSSWSTQLDYWGWDEPSTEFWIDAIPAVKEVYPDILFLAEVYGDYVFTLQEDGFDFTYDKELLDRLKTYNLDYVRSWLSGFTMDFFQHSAHFIENHVFAFLGNCLIVKDEDRAVAVFGSTTIADAAAMVVFTVPGMRFHFEDQWNGFKNKLDVHLRRATTESAVESVVEFYDILNGIVNDDAFLNGVWNYVSVINSGLSWRLMAWRWNYNDESKRIVVVNFSDTTGNGYVVLPDAAEVDGSDTVTITELMTNTTYERSVATMTSSGLFVQVDPWDCQIFSYP